MKNDLKKQYLFHTKEGRRNLLLSLAAILIGVIFLFPIYWMLQISFKSDMETFGKRIWETRTSWNLCATALSMVF